MHKNIETIKANNNNIIYNIFSTFKKMVCFWIVNIINDLHFISNFTHCGNAVYVILTIIIHL